MPLFIENESFKPVLYLSPSVIRRLIMTRMTYNRIKEILAKKGKKNIDLANYMKVDPQTVSGWCRNINQPKYPTLFKISDFLEVEAGDLLTLKKDLRDVEVKKDKKKSPTNTKKKQIKRK